MFIQTEQTPNPATLKFVPEIQVLENGTASFQTKADAEKISPLATALFGVDGVVSVFFGKDFISVTKTEDIQWMDLKPIVLGTLIEFFNSGKAIIDTGTEMPAEEEPAQPTDDDEIIAQIKELLETRVRPAVAQDGGDIVFDSFDDGIVYLSMQGACDGCPSSTATLKIGIENMLKYYIPEVMEVRAK